MLRYIATITILIIMLPNIAVTEEKIDKNDQKAASIVDGAKVYAGNCSICHGDMGDGNTRASSGLRPPPRNFTTTLAAVELTRERMIKSVTDGRPGTGMMAHKDRLNNREIVAVVEYIRNTFMSFPGKGGKTIKNIAGEKIYSKNCSVCHGDRGNSALWARSGLNPPPRDFTTEAARKELTRERMITSVTKGRKGTGMMPFTSKLSKQDIESVVDYIREAFMQPGSASGSNNMAAKQLQPKMMASQSAVASRTNPHQKAAGINPNLRPNPHQKAAGISPNQQSNPHQQRQNPHQQSATAGLPELKSTLAPVPIVDMSLPMPDGLKGDVVAGRNFFMNNCFACHGVGGGGDGPRAHFNQPRPRNFTSPASRRMLNRARIYNGVTNGRVGTVMPAWGKVLTPQQIANVAEFVFQTFVLPKKFGNPDTAAVTENANAGKTNSDKKKAQQSSK